jgi:dTDP-4-amino-4,6-dideoxygalactose transaminase
LKVPYVDLPAQHARLKTRLLEAVGRVLDHASFILGPEVELFENRFAALCGAAHAVGVNSGTDALLLALTTLGIGPGDEVITVPNSFVATASCIALAGARPVFVDVGPDYLMDPEALEAAITPRTRAIMPVHLTGRPADMGRILQVARRHGLAVIEDCAQAVGAAWEGHPVGSQGTIGCFSLHPLKNLNACGDAGVLTTQDAALAERLRRARNLGLRDRNHCQQFSGNSRLDTLQAALLLVKMDYLEEWTSARQANARFYRQALAGLEGLELPFPERPQERSVYHLFVVQAEDRDRLQAYLAERGVGTAVHYPVPIHLQPAAAYLGWGPGSFPRAERQATRILSLPVYPELSSEQRHYVAACIREFYGAEVP